MASVAAGALQGLTVVSFESRRGAEMAELIRRHGGVPVVAPSMREVPLRDASAVADFLARLEAGALDVLIALTGVGMRALAQAAAETVPPARLAELLSRLVLVARGPKPVAALRELGLRPQLTVPEPNTWRDLLASLDAAVPLAGRRVAVQEYGVTNEELLRGLEQRGAEVLRVPVYRWELPEDTGPLREAVRLLAGGGADAVLFTSATQVEHVVRIAAETQLSAPLRAAVRRVLVASIGPICSDAVRRHGMPVDVEPEHPKMGHLVAAVAAKARQVLAEKRSDR